MKPPSVCCIALFALMFSSCATKGSESLKCPVVDLVFVRSVLNERGHRTGIFSITNNGSTVVRLPLENGTTNTVHGRYAYTEQRSPSGAWKPFNPLLDEMIAPKADISAAPHKLTEFRFDGNGLFLIDRRADAIEYSIVVRDRSGCEFRSSPF